MSSFGKISNISMLYPQKIDTSMLQNYAHLIDTHASDRENEVTGAQPGNQVMCQSSLMMCGAGG